MSPIATDTENRLSALLAAITANAKTTRGVCSLHLATTIQMVRKMMTDIDSGKDIKDKIKILESDLEGLLLV